MGSIYTCWRRDKCGVAIEGEAYRAIVDQHVAHRTSGAFGLVGCLLQRMRVGSAFEQGQVLDRVALGNLEHDAVRGNIAGGDDAAQIAGKFAENQCPWRQVYKDLAIVPLSRQVLQCPLKDQHVETMNQLAWL